MRKREFTIAFLFSISNLLFGQNQPDWTLYYSVPNISSIQSRSVLATNNSCYVLASTSDTTCGNYLAQIFKFDSNGNFITSNAFDTVSCGSELESSISITNDRKIFLTAVDSADMPIGWRNGFIVNYDSSLNLIRSSEVCTAQISDPFVNYNCTFLASYGWLDLSTFQLVDTASNILWTYTNAIAFDDPTYRAVFFTSDSIYMVANGNTGFSSSTGHIWIIVSDTAGNIADTVEYDKYSGGVNSIYFTQMLHSREFVYAFINSAQSKFDYGIIDRSGSVIWESQITGTLIDAAVDTVSNLLYLLHAPAINSGPLTLKRINLQTGNALDSLIINSSMPFKSALVLDTAVGAIVITFDSSYNKLILKRLNVYGNNDWNGEVTLQSSFGNFGGATISTNSEIYVTAFNFGGPMVLTKFSQPPLGVESHNNNLEFFINPNPASYFINIVTPNNSYYNQVTLHSVSGDLIRNDFFYSQSILLNTETLMNGLYFVELTTETGQRFTQKLIIQHQ